jgi:uncharacterized protein YkwD
VRARAVCLALLSTAAAHAQPAARYGDPPPQTPAHAQTLEARIAELTAEMARKERREPPRRDVRLDAAMSEIVRLIPDRGSPPNELVQGALWVHGLVEPPPHLVLATMGTGEEREFLNELRGQLPALLAAGRYARIGVGLAPVRGGARVLVALQESFLELEPVPRALPNGGPAPLRARLRAAFVRPEVFVTAPDGRVERLPAGGERARIAATFRCGPARGRYQIELTGEDRFGSTVLANFPVYCGTAAPATAQGAAPPVAARDEPFSTVAAAEKQVWQLVNRDRAQAGLQPLAWDAKLADIARAHSADMLAHGFFGHVSPTTGSASDRTRRAGVDAMLVLENVARAFSAGEAERGLMNSPGHRANILSREATRVGVGIVADEAGGTRELLVTQVFVRPPERLEAHTGDELKRAIASLRATRRLTPLKDDAELDQLAQATARDLARGVLDAAGGSKRVEAALSAEAHRWKAVRTGFAVVGGASQVVDSLKDSLSDAGMTHLGLGLAEGRRREGGTATFAVIVLATQR